MPKPEFADKVMPFGDHLEELRRRLLLALLGVVPILVGALMVGKPVLVFLLRPAERALVERGLPPNFIVTQMFEVFNAHVKVSLVLTILVASPWILYQLWLFIAPGLYPNERRFAYLLAPLSAVLTACSALFMYFVMLPVIFAFFVGFNTDLPLPAPSVPAPVLTAQQVASIPIIPALEADPLPADLKPGMLWFNAAISQLRYCVGTAPDGAPLVRGTPMIAASLVAHQLRVSEYVDQFLNFALAFALAFQAPVVVLLLGWAGLVRPQWLTRYRKYAVMICVVLGSVLTPADPISMFLLAIPLYVLYELGVFLLRVLPAERVGGARAEPGDDPYARPDDQ